MKKTALGLLLGLLVMGIVATGAYAFKGHFGREAMDNAAVQQALENKDYGAFIDALEEARNQLDTSKTITEERFNEMAQMQELRKKIDEAIDNTDYDAWVAAQTALEKAQSITSKIGEENFADYAMMHEAMKDQDIETARELSDKLGIGTGFGHDKMHGMGRP